MRLGRALLFFIILLVLGYGVLIIVQKTGSFTSSLTARDNRDDGLFRPSSVEVIATPIDGGVIFSGVIELPNPCYDMSDPKVTVKNSELVTLEFIAESTSNECIQMIEERAFSVEVFGAISEAVVDLVFNGRKVRVVQKIAIP